MLIGGEGAVPRAMLGGKVSGLLGAAIFPAFNPKCLLGVPNSIFEYIGVAYLTGNKSSGIVPERKSIDRISVPRIPRRQGACSDMCMM